MKYQQFAPAGALFPPILERPGVPERSLYEGRALASSDSFTSDVQVMVAFVPTKGVHTIYATIGDLFAWLCIAGLVILIGMSVMQRRKIVVDERQAIHRPEQVLEEKVSQHD